MYRKIKNLVFHTLVPAVLAALMVPTLAFGQVPACEASIPVEMKTSGSSIPSDVTYKLALEAVTPGAPMPEVTSLTLKVNEKSSFGPIRYTIPEDYQYRIYQKSDAVTDFTYDKKVYTVTIRVTNDDKGGLAADVWGVSDTSGTAKVENILFENSYSKSGGGGGGGGGSSSGGGGSSGSSKGDGLTVITPGPVPQAPGPLTEIVEEMVPLSVLPKTGDTTNLVLWLVLMAVSGCGLLLLLAGRKRFATSEHEQ